MFELLYTSVATKKLREPDLTDILIYSRINNQNMGVTGMLVCLDRQIMQILEGDEEAVKCIFDGIRRDNRHTQVEVFYQGFIDERAFNQWTMAFKLLEGHEASKFLVGYEEFNKDKCPIGMVKDNPNLGKKMFLSLRNFLE